MIINCTEQHSLNVLYFEPEMNKMEWSWSEWNKTLDDVDCTRSC